MFCTTNNQLLPVIVVNGQGKRKKAKLVKLVVNESETSQAVIQQVIVDLHKK